jgi:hypothetical protein
VRRWRVPLPRGAGPPYRVFVNGVPQAEGKDYEIAGRELRFFQPLHSVDVQYRLGGRDAVATGLEIIPPEGD